MRDNATAQGAIGCTGGYGSVIGTQTHGLFQFGGAFYFSGTWSKLADGCKSGSMYLTSDCKLGFDDGTNKRNICGKINLVAEISTPISLVWSDDYRDIPCSIVGFKLNPHSTKTTWAWRGSSSLPLLVFDPKHGGEITLAAQLFGAWTFGGHTRAGGTDVEPWKDGYAALATLDTDGNGKVAGSELAPLALWFDANRDGISQKGEVRGLEDVLVTALYYKPDAAEENSPMVKRGYDRLVKGETQTGASIDWSEKSVSDIAALNPDLDTSTSVKSALTTEPKPSLSAVPEGHELANHFAGIWGWTLPKPMRGSGLLAFDISEDGIVGLTLNEARILGIREAGSRAHFAYFRADPPQLKDGQPELEYSVQPREGGPILRNVARLSQDGTKLIGRTVVSDSTVTASGSYEYAWEALRIVHSEEAPKRTTK